MSEYSSPDCKTAKATTAASVQAPSPRTTNNLLGKFPLDGGVQQNGVMFDIDADGFLNVGGHDKSSGERPTRLPSEMRRVDFAELKLMAWLQRQINTLKKSQPSILRVLFDKLIFM